MHSIRWGCQSVLSISRSIYPVSNGSRRVFSRSTACQRGSLPQFLEPSNSELSSLLSAINSKILLPEHLTRDQCKLVYKQANRARLEAEPIEITLGEITLPLEHIDRNRDLPRRREIIRNVVKASKTPEDWENVMRMIEGFKDAGIRLQPRWLEMIVRKLHGAGMQHLVLKGFQRARKTGLRLKNDGLVLQAFRGLHVRAVTSGWDAAETKKALAFAEQFVELMEEVEHLGESWPGPGDPRSSPLVIAYPLELAALTAKLQTEGLDQDGKVMKYARRVMKATQMDSFMTTTLSDKLAPIYARQTTPYKNKYDRNRDIRSLKDTMFEFIPLWNALRLSTKILGADMPMRDEAEKLQHKLENMLAIGQRVLDSEAKDGFLESPGGVVDEINQCKEI